MLFKNSQEVIDKIELKRRNGIELRQLKAFMQANDNPQLKLKCIHVAGTNGKGSTANDIASILMAAGYRVGLFTSPYLETHHDRIRINGIFIPDQKIVDIANQFYDEWMQYGLSMFEIDMFIAVQYFLSENCDYCVFEVGLGGEKDATNIIDPLVSVITNIGMDHMEELGNSLASICRAKAGIIKDNRALVTAVSQPECLEILKDVCQQHHSEMIVTGSASNIKVDSTLQFDYRNFKAIKQHTMAVYQVDNIKLAIEAALYLRKHQYAKISDTNIYQGIEAALWKGRFEVISQQPLLIIDGAHNEEGMSALVESVKRFDEVHILFSALKDKPTDKMLEHLLEVSDDITVTEFDFYRAASAESLAGDYPVKINKDYRDAINKLMENPSGLHLICGSLYFISDVRAYLKEKGASTLL